jgi:hypothetical protein
MKARIALAATPAILVAACGGTTTRTGSTTPGQPASGPPRSQLVNVTLPPGSTVKADPKYPDIELWHDPLEVTDAVAQLRPQLPINAPYDGRAWCSEDINPKLETTSWNWGTEPDFVQVSVSPYYPKIGVRGPGSDVTIIHGSMPGGCGPELPTSGASWGF